MTGKMKYLLIILSIALISCDSYPEYYRTYRDILPDSLKEEKQKFIIELVTAASFHMTGGDYEDPEDVIQQAARTFDEINETYTEGLRIVRYHGDYGLFIPRQKLDSTQLKIFLEFE